MTDRQTIDCPYVGLKPFSERESRFFFGRERERRIIAANLRTSRLTILYGPTGVGKSSVLQAGVVPDLNAKEPEVADQPKDLTVAVLYHNRWGNNPRAGLIREIEQRSGDAAKADRDSKRTTVATALQAWARNVGHLLIVLDQFEEFLLHHPDDDHSLILDVAAAVNDESIRANFLIALREDALSALDRLQEEIPDLFDNLLRLNHLTLKSAESAIQDPIPIFNKLADDYDVEVEPGLVDAVLTDEIITGFEPLSRSGKGQHPARDFPQSNVAAPYLQLVLSHVWKKDVKSGRGRLRLETFQKLGGGERIVSRHLDDAMNALSRAQQKMMASVFDRLVTPSGAKVEHSAQDLAGYSKTSVDDLSKTLQELSGDARILRCEVSAESDEPRYAIFHDVLADAVIDWIARFEQTQKFRRSLILVVVLAAFAVVAGVLTLNNAFRDWDTVPANDESDRLPFDAKKTTLFWNARAGD